MHDSRLRGSPPAVFERSSAYLRNDVDAVVPAGHKRTGEMRPSAVFAASDWSASRLVLSEATAGPEPNRSPRSHEESAWLHCARTSVIRTSFSPDPCVLSTIDWLDPDNKMVITAVKAPLSTVNVIRPPSMRPDN